MTAAPVVQRAGHKSRRPSWDWLKRPTWEELAQLPPRIAALLYGVAVIPGRWVLYHPDAAPPARRPRTALGSGVVKPLGGPR
ncbi:hypothetical protein WMF30_40040 [Sorangium sp. So ce134]